MANLPGQQTGVRLVQSSSNVLGHRCREKFFAGLQNPLSIFISEALARRDLIKDRIVVAVGDQRASGRVARGRRSFPTSSKQRCHFPVQLLIMDLPALQQLTDQAGRLDRVEFVLEAGPHRAEQWRRIKEKLAAANPANAPRWMISSPLDRRSSAATMTRAFRLNLTILSLLALLVGLYLVFQELTAPSSGAPPVRSPCCVRWASLRGQASKERGWC